MKLLRLSEVARRLAVSERDVRDWVRSGAMPSPVRLPSGCVRFRSEDLVGWLASLPPVIPPPAPPPPPRRLTPTAEAILRTLQGQSGKWMSGAEVAVAMGIDHTTGAFRKAIALLRAADLIESSQSQGYRVAGPSRTPS